MSWNNKFYLTRDGKPSPYNCALFEDETNLNAIIVILKNLDYPFSADEWYRYVDLQKPNPLGKYINLMNIGNFKPLRFEDSKSLNVASQNLKRLYREINNPLYFEVVDKVPDLSIKTEEIKSNTFKKPKYLIAYDENDNPIAKFKHIKDMNITFDYNTASTQDALGHMVFSWTSDKILSTNFTCGEIIVFSPENKTITNGYSNEVPKVGEETDFTKEVDAFIRSLKGE